MTTQWSNDNTDDLADIFDEIQGDEERAADGMSQVFLGALVDLADDINAQMGVPVDDIKASEIVYISLVLDNTVSTEYNKNYQEIVKGYNHYILELSKANGAMNMYVCANLIDGTPLYPYLSVNDAPLLTTRGVDLKVDPVTGRTEEGDRRVESFYPTASSTPLYDSYFTTAGGAKVKVKGTENKGAEGRSLTIVFSDGDDTGSHKVGPQECSELSASMLREEIHILAMVVVPYPHVDVKAVGMSMGIPERFILEPNEDNLLEYFGFLSQVTQTVSQSADSFTKLQSGGFKADL